MRIKMLMKRNECLFNADGMGHTLLTLSSGTIIDCVSIEEYTGKYNHNQSVRLMKITLADGRYYTLSTLVYAVIK